MHPTDPTQNPRENGDANHRFAGVQQGSDIKAICNGHHTASQDFLKKKLQRRYGFIHATACVIAELAFNAGGPR
jgi:hypothetical protein